MIETAIDRSEIQKPRAPREFIAWFEDLLSRINGRREHHAQILLHKGIAKDLFEEVFPLYRLLQHREDDWANRRFQNILGSQSYDVRVTSSTEEDSFIEISVADRDFTEVQRMRYFEKHGSVSAIGKVTSTGSKRLGFQIEVEQEAQLHSKLVSEKAKKIEEAIERKCALDYQARTSLMIYFDDHTSFSEPEDDMEMSKLLKSVEQLWRPRFDALFVVGASGRRVWSAGT